MLPQAAPKSGRLDVLSTALVAALPLTFGRRSLFRSACGAKLHRSGDDIITAGQAAPHQRRNTATPSSHAILCHDEAQMVIQFPHGPLSRPAFSSLARMARSVSRLNSAAPYNTQACPPISKHWTWCFWIEERTLRIGFGIKGASKCKIGLPETRGLRPALGRGEPVPLGPFLTHQLLRANHIQMVAVQERFINRTLICATIHAALTPPPSSP